MSDHAEFTTSQFAGFVASLWTQIRAAFRVGLPSEEESRPSEESAARDGFSSRRGSVRSMDDYAGYYTSNGLCSLDVGGDRSRWGE